MEAMVVTPVRETSRFDGPLHWTRVLEFVHTATDKMMDDMATGHPLLMVFDTPETQKHTGTVKFTADLCIVRPDTVDGMRFASHLETDHKERVKAVPDGQGASSDATKLVYYHSHLISTAFAKLGYLPAWSIVAVNTMRAISQMVGMTPARNMGEWNAIVGQIVVKMVAALGEERKGEARVRENMTTRARCIGSLRRISMGLGPVNLYPVIAQRLNQRKSYTCFVCGADVVTTKDIQCLGETEIQFIPSLSCRHDDHIELELKVMK
jgi:hypothetical protein